VKDQELNPRPHTPRPAALPVKVEQWVKGKGRKSQEAILHEDGNMNLINPKTLQAILSCPEGGGVTNSTQQTAE